MHVNASTPMGISNSQRQRVNVLVETPRIYAIYNRFIDSLAITFVTTLLSTASRGRQACPKY